MNPLVSIVIPVYNCSKYVEHCITSCINQEYRNIQIVVVNDGSTDNSEKIIKKMMLLDNRIIHFSKKNAGVSSARNKGLEMSSGEYIVFLDGDDQLEKSAISTLVAIYKQKKTDDTELLVCCGRNLVEQKNGKEKYINTSVAQKNQSVDQQQTLFAVGTGKFNLQSACYKLFRNDIIKKNSIRFDESIDFGEDGLFVFQYIYYIDRLEYVSAPLWNIFIRKDSAQHSSFSKKKISALTAIEKMKEYTPKPDVMLDRLNLYKVERIEEVLASAIDDNVLNNRRYIHEFREELRSYRTLVINADISLIRKIRYLRFTYVPIYLLKYLNIGIKAIKAPLKKYYFMVRNSIEGKKYENRNNNTLS